jgi:uncharacterized membrane protein YfcA
MDGLWFWMAAVVAAVAVGMGKGGLPLVAMLAVPVMSLVISPVTAAGILLPVYVVSDVFGLYAYRHAYDRRVLAIVLPGAVLGIGIGWATAHLVPDWAVTALVGVIGASFALNLLIGRGAAREARRAKVGPGLFWGMITGFTSFVSHSGAPPYQVYTLPLKMPKVVFAGTATIAFAIINVVKLVPYFLLGQLSPQNVWVSAVLGPVAAMAVFGGVRLVKWLPDAMFFRIVIWTLLAVSLKLLWDSAGYLL